MLTLGNRIIERHAIFSLAIVLVYLVLNLPAVIMVSQLGFTVWFPATGLNLAVMLGISPWYFPLTLFASTFAGAVIYHQPVVSWRKPRDRIAKQLAERTDFLNSLIENNPLGIVVHNREGRVQLCNEAFANLFLYSREEMVGNILDRFNRRFMEDALYRELQRAKCRRHSLVVVFLDLDQFRRFNDIYGHDAGDTVLRSMAGLFRQHFRGDDIVCRYGGEEFAFILSESSAEDAAKRVEQLRQVAKRHKIIYKEQKLDAVTFSVGIAAFPEDAPTSEELLQVADACLYESKGKGRDCVTIAASPKAKS